MLKYTGEAGARRIMGRRLKQGEILTDRDELVAMAGQPDFEDMTPAKAPKAPKKARK